MKVVTRRVNVAYLLECAVFDACQGVHGERWKIVERLAVLGKDAPFLAKSPLLALAVNRPVGEHAKSGQLAVEISASAAPARGVGWMLFAGCDTRLPAAG